MSALLDAYCARIGYAGPRAPTLEVLRALHALHPAAIAFESIDPFLGRGVMIDPDAVRAKLLGARRGGYCHEQNGLFEQALGAIGFDFVPLGARVVWARPDGKAPLTHRLTLVHVPDGPYIADVGFGGPTPTAPLRLEPDTVQETPHGTYRIMRDGVDLVLELRLPARWAPLYRFRLEAQNPIDFEVANWFTAMHPASPFTRNLVCARVDGARRLTLMNRTLSVREADGSVTRRDLTGAAELGDVLERRFGLDVPVPVEALWEKVAAMPAGAAFGPE